jgi:vacuolar-type H+-ATPase subunit C/Vma6
VIKATKYANVLAKIGSERSSLLSEAKLKALTENKSVAEFASQLRGTSYQDKIAKATLPLNSRKLENVFQENLIDTYIKTVKNSPKTVSSYLKMYIFRFELENIKALIKGVYAELRAEEKQSNIYPPLEDFLKNRAVFEEAAKATYLKQLVTAFKKTEYFSALSLGLKRFEEIGSTLYFDVLLDKQFYEKLCMAFRELPAKEKRHALFYAGMEIDGFVIFVLLRGKALNYDAQWLRVAIPKCSLNLSKETIDALISAADYESALNIVMKSSYGKYFAKAQTVQETLTNAQKAFRNALFEHALRNRVAEEFNVAVPLGFMVQKEAETRNLAAIVLGLDNAVKPEEIQGKLFLSAS